MISWKNRNIVFPKQGRGGGGGPRSIRVFPKIHPNLGMQASLIKDCHELRIIDERQLNGRSSLSNVTFVCIGEQLIGPPCPNSQLEQHFQSMEKNLEYSLLSYVILVTDVVGIVCGVRVSA